MGEPPPVSVSVIVCTRDRAEDLRRALPSILASTYGDFELIVVDQSNPPLGHDIIDWNDARLRFVRDDGAGLSRARNLGIAAARGSLIVFTDDDCVVEAGWLERIVQAFESDAGAGIVFGAVVPAPCDPKEGFIVGYEPPKPRRLKGSSAKRHDGGIGANMALRRSALERTGGFDELLGAGGYFPSCEDGDMAYRVLHAGFALLHVPQARVIHYGLRDWASGSDLTKRTYLAVAAAYTKHARMGDPVGAFLVAQSIGMAAMEIVRSLLARRRPLGVRRLLAHFTGIRRSFELDVDRERRVYVRRS